MKKDDIIKSIEHRVKSCTDPAGRKYSRWIIGITDDTKRRKAEHNSDGKHTEHWKDWKVDSEKDTRAVEEHFLDKGMKGGGGGGKHPIFVYIF